MVILKQLIIKHKIFPDGQKDMKKIHVLLSECQNMVGYFDLGQQLTLQ